MNTMSEYDREFLLWMQNAATSVLSTCQVAVLEKAYDVQSIRLMRGLHASLALIKD